MKRKYTAKTTRKNAWSFGNLFGRVFSAFLLIVVFISPLAPAFASEDVAGAVDAASSAVSEPSEPTDTGESETETKDGIDNSGASQDESAQVSAESVSDLELTTSQNQDTITHHADEADTQHSNQDDTHTAIEENVNDDSEILTEGNPIMDGDKPVVPDTHTVTVEVTSTPEQLISASEITDGTEAVLSEDNQAASSSDSAAVVEGLSTTTPEAIVQPVVSEGFTFSQNECVPTGDGSYYCTRPKEVEIAEMPTDGVFARLDEKGDKEIYLERRGIVTQITDNEFDDNAPYFDESSATIVWHRLIDGRYQIMSYDLNSQTEKQITFDRYNNMEPQIFGNTIVWQGWVGNDWEIFMLTGDNLLMLTDNTIQDITPSINGDHIVWQSFEGEAWRMKVYDIRTKQVETIEDAGGASIENPRFVLVYDTKFASGDVETRGYDLKSGKVVFLDSKPAPLPEKIPDPEQTGEDRALVVPPPQPKAKVDSDDDLDQDSAGTGPLPHDDDQDDGMTLVIPGTQGEMSDDLLASSTESGIDDLILQVDQASTTTADVSHIDDLVVEPYVPPPSVDSQEAIEAVD